MKQEHGLPFTLIKNVQVKAVYFHACALKTHMPSFTQLLHDPFYPVGPRSVKI